MGVFHWVSFRRGELHQRHSDETVEVKTTLLTSQRRNQPSGRRRQSWDGAENRCVNEVYCSWKGLSSFLLHTFTSSVMTMNVGDLCQGFP